MWKFPSHGGHGMLWRCSMAVEWVLCGWCIPPPGRLAGEDELPLRKEQRMCGIVGFLDKTHNAHAAVGSVLCAMLRALGCRGPDSAGVALYGNGQAGDLVLQIKLGERGDFEAKSQEIVARVQRLGTLRERSRTAEYLRLVLSDTDDPLQMERLIEAADDHV